LEGKFASLALLRGAAVLLRGVKRLRSTAEPHAGKAVLLCMGLFSRFLFGPACYAGFIVRKVME